jgi:tetratricopeptide (TPR) repeat protein
MAPHSRIFVGRKTELEQFQSIIERPEVDSFSPLAPRRAVKPRVFLPHGIGGIGKTELSRRCAEIAAEAGWRTITIDWENVEYRPVEPMQLMNGIANALKAVAGEKAIKPYLEDQQNIAAVNGRVNRYRVDHPAEWQKALEVARASQGVLPDPTTKTLAAAAAFTMDVGPKIMAKLADELAARKILKNAKEAALYKNPEIQLAHHLVKAIIDATRDEPLLMVFDTCEWLSLSLEEFLRDLIVCPAVEQGSDLMFIISGRFSQSREREVEDSNGNRKRVKGYADRLADSPPIVWDLSEFADPEVADYLRESELESTPELTGFVQRLARGVPFAVQLVTEALLKLGSEQVKQDFPPKNAEDYDSQEMVTQVVRRFLRYCMDNAADEDRLRALALLRTRDDAALRAVWALKPEEKPRQILADLEARYGFIQFDGSLHDVVREFLRDSLRGEDRETARLLGQKAATYYRPLWDSETAELPVLADRLAEERWRGLTLDVLNALCWYNDLEAMRFLAGRAVEAMQFNWPFALGLLKLVHEFREAAKWWPTRSKRHYDALTRAIRGQKIDEMIGLESLLRDSVNLALDIEQIGLIQIWRARNLLEQDQAQAALAICLEAEKNLPTDESVRLILADMFGRIGSTLGFKQGDAIFSEEARTAYEHATTHDPEQPAYHNGLGVMLAVSKHAGNLDLALARFARALELDPNGAEVYSNRGNTYDAKQDYLAALADYTLAVEIDPNFAGAYSNRGGVYANLKDYPAALADYTRALELDPNYAQAYYNRGNTYDEQEDYPAALADYTRALELNPNDAAAYYNRGNTYAKQKNYPAALADFTHTLELDPNDAAAYYNRGLMHANLKNYPAALTDLTGFLKLNPNDAAAYYYRGNMYAKQKDYPAALTDYTRALELDPNYAQAYCNRGDMYAAQNDYPAALADYTRALELDPNDDIVVYNMTCLYALQNDVEQACTWLRKAIAMSKENAGMAQTESDFDAIRDTPEFKALMQEFGNQSG